MELHVRFYNPRVKNKTCLSFHGRTVLSDLSSLPGRPVPGKCLIVNRPPMNDRISKVYGPTLFRKCLFCLFSQKLRDARGFFSSVATVILSRGTAKGPALSFALSLSVMCKVSATGWRQHPSALPATIDQWGIKQLSCCTTSLLQTVIMTPQ